MQAWKARPKASPKTHWARSPPALSSWASPSTQPASTTSTCSVSRGPTRWLHERQVFFCRALLFCAGPLPGPISAPWGSCEGPCQSCTLIWITCILISQIVGPSAAWVACPLHQHLTDTNCAASLQGVVLDCDHLEPDQLDRFPPATEAAAAHQQAKADGQVAGNFPLWLALDEVTDPVSTWCQRQRPVRLLKQGCHLCMWSPFFALTCCVPAAKFWGSMPLSLLPGCGWGGDMQQE